jgi:hypothetical protein
MSAGAFGSPWRSASKNDAGESAATSRPSKKTRCQSASTGIHASLHRAEERRCRESAQQCAPPLWVTQQRPAPGSDPGGQSRLMSPLVRHPLAADSDMFFRHDPPPSVPRARSAPASSGCRTRLCWAHLAEWREGVPQVRVPCPISRGGGQRLLSGARREVGGQSARLAGDRSHAEGRRRSADGADTRSCPATRSAHGSR